MKLIWIWILLLYSNNNVSNEVKKEIYSSTLLHKEIVLKQAILETGYFKSYNCKVRKNLFGLYDSRRNCYYSYNSYEECVQDYYDKVQYRYSGGNYYEFLECLYKDNEGNCKRYAQDPNYIQKLKSIKI